MKTTAPVFLLPDCLFCRELKKLKQRKEAIDMESLEEIKINLYSKIKRRLGLQALLTTLRVNMC